MTIERIRVPDQPQPDLVDRVATAIRAGQLVVLPTETVYGIAVSPECPAGVQALTTLKGRDEQHPFTYHLGAREDLERHAQPPGRRVRALIDRYWPGPLTLVLEGLHQSTIGVRLPAHDFTRAVIAAVGHPLWMTSVNRTGEPPLVDPDDIAAAFPNDLAMLLDDGVTALKSASTVVRCTDRAFAVLREGILSAADVLDAAARSILFVCTGNTCRSPLAEAIARQTTATELAVDANQVLALGLRFRSAGAATLGDMPASSGSLAAGAEIGLDLSTHRSAALTRELTRAASRIYCLTQAHRFRVLQLDPGVADRTDLLRPDGGDIADPFGGDLDTYRRVREEIAAAVRARVDEWLALAES